MFKMNDSASSPPPLFDNTRVTESMNKCAIIFRDEPLNQYIFVCYHCGETFSNSIKIIEHLDEIHFTSQSSLSLLNNATKTDIKDEPIDSVTIDETSFENLLLKTDQNNLSENDDSIFFTSDTELQPTEQLPNAAVFLIDTKDEKKSNKNKIKSIKKSSIDNGIKPKDNRKVNSKKSTVPKPSVYIYKCALCDDTKIYSKKQYYQNHINRKHKSVREFQCDHCTYISKTKGTLLKHLHNVHVKSTKFKCSICDKTFTYKNSYVFHQRYHTGEKPYQCYLCGVSFVTSSHLAKHMKSTIHSTKTYKCEKCVKIFSSEEHLKTHLKTHAENRSHKCSVCGNDFKSRKTLAQHMYLHSNVKRFKCNYCDMKFAQSTGRRGHERLKHLSLYVN